MAGWQNGSCRGLQILVYWFDSGTDLQKKQKNEKSTCKKFLNRVFISLSILA